MTIFDTISKRCILDSSFAKSDQDRNQVLYSVVLQRKVAHVVFHRKVTDLNRSAYKSGSLKEDIIIPIICQVLQKVLQFRYTIGFSLYGRMFPITMVTTHYGFHKLYRPKTSERRLLSDYFYNKL